MSTQAQRIHPVRRPGGMLAAAALLLLAAGSCKLNKNEIPPLAGPSEMALSLQLTATPDVLTANGFSTSSIQVRARNENGQPASGIGLYFAISDAAGNFGEIGTLSSDTATTGSNGIAQVIYRTPPRTDATANRSVLVEVRPIGGDANGQLYRRVKIELRSAEPRLFPPGAGGSAPRCNFVMEPALGVGRVGQIFLFQTSSSDDGAIVRYEWDFGDGATDDKPDTSHRYSWPGQYSVVHVVTDDGGQQSACQAGVLVE